MSFREVQGDLFQVPGLDAIAHGVNTIGRMGAGIAAKFRLYFPDMFREYQLMCQLKTLQPGDIFAYRAFVRRQWIYNLATQPRTGACAKLTYIEQALAKMVDHAHENGVFRIGVCQLGCGYGGLDYHDVRPIIEKAVSNQPIEIVVAIWTPPQ